MNTGGEGSTSDILRKARQEAYNIDLSFLEPKKKLTFDYNVSGKKLINEQLAEMDKCLDSMKDLVDNWVKNFEEAFMSWYYGIEYELRKWLENLKMSQIEKTNKTNKEINDIKSDREFQRQECLKYDKEC